MATLKRYDGTAWVPVGADSFLTLTGAARSYVRFVDQNGNPLPVGSKTTIVVNTATGQIDDITYQGPA